MAISGAYAAARCHGAPRERRDQPAAGRPRASSTQLVDDRDDHRHRRVVVGIDLRVLDLDVHEHPIAARVEHLGERRRTECVQVVERLRQRVVGHEQPAVRGASHVEFDAVGAHSVGERKGLGGVLRCGGRRAAMCEDEHRPIMVEQIEREVNKGRMDPCGDRTRGLQFLPARAAHRPAAMPHPPGGTPASATFEEHQRVDPCVQPHPWSSRLRVA